MGFGQRIGDTLRVPGRGLRRAVVVVVVLALAGATGGAVALTAPVLLAQIRPSQSDAALPPVPARLLRPLPTSAPAPTAAGLTTVLDPMADAMAGDFTGTVLDPDTGSVLWQRDAADAMAPGSTGKLLTTAAALLTLNPTGTLTTRVVAGTTPGTVVLVGGGDPTLTALPDGETGVYPDPARLTTLAARVKAAVPGITKVMIDTSRYTGPTMASGWDPADIKAGNFTPIEPLMLDGGRIDPGARDGERVENPADVAGLAFAKLLGLDQKTVDVVKVPDDATQIAAVSSAPISDLVENTIQISDNVSAEVLARETAITRGGDPSFTGGVKETLAALSAAGLDPTGAVMSDGSGLSTDDRVPARLLGAILSSAAAPAQGPDDTEFLRPILAGLPVAGGDGTLEDRFATDAKSAAGRGVVRAKTGTLTDVSSLAGVVTDADGRLLVFAMMSNGVLPSKARPRLDDIAAKLSGCGCR